MTETARVAKALVAAYYGRSPQKSYFAGCSTGGRMGLMAAQRFPADFDGIIAGAPALDYTGLVATHGAWVTQANLRPTAARSWIAARSRIVAAAVVSACDARDGRTDGLIDDPRNCDWQPSSLACGREPAADLPDRGGDRCAREVVRGTRDASGKQLYPGGIPRGSEPYWPLWLTGKPGDRMPGLVPLFAQDFLRYMAFADDPGETYRVQEFDFERDPARLARDGSDLQRRQPGPQRLRRRGAAS